MPRQPLISFRMKYLLLLFAVLFHQVALARGTVAFYFGAHEDDWQLFMNPNAYRDVQADSTRVVFVYLTAGDAGAGVGNVGRSRPYYLARENGAKMSVMFMADADNTPVVPTDSMALLGGHAIKRWVYRDTVSYFFRLPDGDMEGTGYPETRLQSLKRLHEGSIPAITAIDGSTTYESWRDLTEVLRKLIDRERRQATNVWINIPDTDINQNGGDHSDHQHTARGVLEAIADLSCINRAFYLDYVMARLDENLSTPDRDVKAGTFAAMGLGLNALDHPSNWDAKHRVLLSRQYVRTAPAAERCSH